MPMTDHAITMTFCRDDFSFSSVLGIHHVLYLDHDHHGLPSVLALYIRPLLMSLLIFCFDILDTDRRN